MTTQTGTVAAISTPLGAGGIGVIRISGDEAFSVADRLFRAVSGKPLKQAAGYTAHYGRVFDGDGDFDEAVATIFRAPKSYTGEDVVELSLHGGLYLLKRALRAALQSGATLAGPGEFTRRAYLNGKMTLTAAESVMDLIGAKGLQAARAALAGRDGVLARKIDEISSRLTDIAAHLAAWNDFPDEDMEMVQPKVLLTHLTRCKADCEALLATFDTGKILHEGVETAIIGRPNVGKSTLMNLLTGTQKSIVTSIAGTTRDVVEETVFAGEILLRLADTAGIRPTDDPIESVGVDLAKKRLSTAQLVLAVFDRSEPLSAQDLALLKELADRPAIAILNKSDLPPKIDLAALAPLAERVVEISAKSGEGGAKLVQAIAQVLHVADINPAEPLIANERQRDCLQKAVQALSEAAGAAGAGVTLDAVSVLLDEAIAPLLELAGKRVSDTVVDTVFSQFCVGK